MLNPCTLLKSHPTTLTIPRFILYVNILIPRFFINSTIWPLHTNTAPKTHVTTIGFGPHCHIPATNNFYPTSRIGQNFQTAFTVRQVLVENTTANIPLLAKNGCDLSKIIPLICNLTLKNDTLVSLKIWLNYPEHNSLHQSITSYSTLLPPYWSIKTPSLPSDPFKWDSYEVHYYKWSYLLYSLHIPSTFNAFHCRPISHGRLHKHLHDIHRQWIFLDWIFCCPTAPGGEKN